MREHPGAKGLLEALLEHSVLGAGFRNAARAADGAGCLNGKTREGLSCSVLLRSPLLDGRVDLRAMASR
jgi:hypothetical protein